jgi:hypothetical protein
MENPPELPFESYNKISESSSHWVIPPQLSKKFSGGKTGTKWCVTEKAHGSNLCLLTDGTVVKTAKRREILREGDEFFGYSEINC